MVWGNLVLAAMEARGAVDGDHVRADALDVGAHLQKHAREVLHVWLASRVADHGGPRGQRSRHERVLGRHHGRLIHEHVRGLKTSRRVEDDLPPELDGSAQGAEGI